MQEINSTVNPTINPIKIAATSIDFIATLNELNIKRN